MPFDYQFVQKLSNFGRDLGGKFVGQPFKQYRLTAASTSLPGPSSAVNDPLTGLPIELSIKLSALRNRVQVENETLHLATFEALVSSDRVKTEDVIVQNDAAYGGDSTFVVGSLRPLKQVIVVRAESVGQLYRANANRASGYSGPTNDTQVPFVLNNGQFILGTAGDPATPIPVGVTYIGQIKDQKITHLPTDTTTAWWYVYVPLFPGLTRLREDDVIVVQEDAAEAPVRYRIHAAYITKVGVRGAYCLCERI